MATKLNTLLESPGVVINEREIAQATTNAIGTNVFIPGFTPQGPTDEPTPISTLTEFEEIFGLPTTPAERYSHNAVKQLLTTSNAAVTFTRMPYGSGAGYGFTENYNALIFPVVGLSAVEKNVCDFFRTVPLSTIQNDYPWLAQDFVPTEICYGSSNLNCPLNSIVETPANLYIHDNPFEYDSIVSSIKFISEGNSTVYNKLAVFQLSSDSSGTNTSYTIINRYPVSSLSISQDSDQTNVGSGVRYIASFTGPVHTLSAGILSGQTVSGVLVPQGTTFASFTNGATGALNYFNASSDIANSVLVSSVTSVPANGTVVTIANTAISTSTVDSLISFCSIPTEAGLTCSTITALGLQIPEDQKYDFYPVTGDAQLNDANFYVLGEPISKTLSIGEYQLLQNQQFNWKCGVYENGNPALDIPNNDVRAGLVVVNKLKSAQLEDFTGYYLAINDNLNVNPATDFDDLTAVAGYYNELCPGVSGEWIQVPQDRLNFKVSETFDGTAGSITEIVHQNVGTEFGNDQYKDSLIVSFFKIKPSRVTTTINKLDQIRLEQFVGSLNSERKVHDDFGGPDRSFYIEQTVNNGSNYLEMYVNPYISQNNCWNDSLTNLPQKTVRMFRERTGSVFSNFDASIALRGYADKLYGTGSLISQCSDALYNTCISKDIGNMPSKLERALRGVENPIEYPIDITIDNGLSTMWATRAAVQSDSCITDPSICYNYDDTYFVNTDSLSPYDGTVMNSALQDSWEVIFNIFDSFARYTRKAAGGVPHVHIQDPLRQIFVNGKDYKVVQRQKNLFIDPLTNQPTEKYATFGRNIYSYLRNLYQGINSSYSISYANWIKSYDSNSDKFNWYGPSAYEASLLARNDFSQYPWTSPLGVNNGQLANINDLAINPNQRERDLISRISLNPIVRFPEGNLNWNSTTLIKDASALKEISIRRGALWLAKSIQANLVQFIGEPNTITTRTRITNTLKPILDFMKDNNGIYDYMLVCDERNNTPASIDQGVLNVAVYIKPTRPVKFILVDLVITGTGVNFNELI